MTGYGMDIPSPGEQARSQQAVENESWPQRDSHGFHARGLHDRPHPIDVRVRIVWAIAGEQIIEGRALRWNRSHVYVVFADTRLATQGVWVLARDVRRR